MYCTQCKIETKETAKFCPKCGGRLVSQTTPEIQAMQCPQCGKIYGTDHQFCANDGSQLEPQRTPSDALPKPTPIAIPTAVLKIALLVLALLFLAVFGTGGYLYYSGRWVDIPMLVKWFTPPSAQNSKPVLQDRSNMSKIAIKDSHIDAENKVLQTIDIVIGDCIFGNHLASFDTVYKDKKIEVALNYDGTTKFFKGNKEIKKWIDTFWPNPDTDKSPLSGKTAKIKGKWESVNNFEAYEVYLKP